MAVAPRDYRKHGLQKPVFKGWEIAQTEMPTNIKKFKQLEIGFVPKFDFKTCFSRHLDDEVLTFLDKVKPLFTNVNLSIGSKQSTKLRILFGHLLPKLGSIHEICCDNDDIKLLEQHYPGTLALAKELVLVAEPAFIPAYLDWLNAPLDCVEHGRPRLLVMGAESETIHAIVEAVRTV